MSEKIDIVQRAHTLREIVKETCERYYHSRPMIQQDAALLLKDAKQKHSFNFSYSIKDLLLIGALTQSSVLMTGGTDLGKTTLARLVMNSLFGAEDKGWHRIDVDVDFGKDTVTDTDFRVIVEGKKSSEGLYSIQPFYRLPGLITDEINRSHAKLVTKLIHMFDKDVSLTDGTRVKIGFDYGSGNYQFQIAAINEGEEYSGTFDIDKALRRRTVIEIPMDIFPALASDRQRIRKDKRSIDLINEVNHAADIIEVYKALGGIPLHTNADLFLAYMESFDYCENSLTKDKGSISSKGGSVYHVCTKPVHGTDTVCRFIKSFENELCPYIRATTPGISKNLIIVAKGLSILRAVRFGELLHAFVSGKMETLEGIKLYSPNQFEESLQQFTGAKYSGRDLARVSFEKYVSDLSIQTEDIEGVFGFVGYSKVGLSAPWIAKHYQGNRFHGVSSFVGQAKQHFEECIAKLDIFDGEPLQLTTDRVALEEYCRRENPWFWRVLEPYLNPDSSIGVKKQDMDYLYRG